MHKILKLWAIPRSTSTAFEWMVRQRGDMTCFHEPFGEAWYQGENPLWPLVKDESVRTPGLTLESVLKKLIESAKQGPVFSKDFPHYIKNMWDDKFLAQFTHSFLIRDPAKTITSMYDKWPNFHEKEVGFAEQRTLFELITKRDGTPPPVIDSDDLLEDPEGIISLWCNAVGIEFIPSALSWKEGARDEVSWWDGGSFHANLRNSTGLRPQSRSQYIDITQAPDRVQQIHGQVRAHYEHLYAHRLEV